MPQHTEEELAKAYEELNDLMPNILEALEIIVKSRQELDELDDLKSFVL
jgi:hypothetical protein